MDSLGDYIYLILLVLAGLSGLLKKKKETSSSKPKSNPTTTKKSWEDVLRDLVPIEEEETFRTPELVTQATTKVPEPFLNFENTAESIIPLDKKPTTRFVNTFLAKEKVDNQQNMDTTNGFLAQIQLNTLDDAKRAFVYSEIFNRKY